MLRMHLLFRSATGFVCWHSSATATLVLLLLVRCIQCNEIDSLQVTAWYVMHAYKACLIRSIQPTRGLDGASAGAPCVIVFGNMISG